MNKRIKNIFKNKEMQEILLMDSMSKNIELVEELKKRVKELETKWENIPQYKCHLCKETIKQGRIEWMHKYFHKSCFDEYQRLIEKPKEDYKSVKGWKVKVYE